MRSITAAVAVVPAVALDALAAASSAGAETAPPAAAPERPLLAVSCVSATDCVAAGGLTVATDVETDGFSEFWNGKTRKLVATA